MSHREVWTKCISIANSGEKSEITYSGGNYTLLADMNRQVSAVLSRFVDFHGMCHCQCRVKFIQHQSGIRHLGHSFVAMDRPVNLKNH